MSSEHTHTSTAWWQWLEDIQARSAEMFGADEPEAGGDFDRVRAQTAQADRLHAALARLAEQFSAEGHDDSPAWAESMNELMASARQCLEGFLAVSDQQAPTPVLGLVTALAGLLSGSSRAAQASQTWVDPLLGFWSQAMEQTPRLGMLQHHQAQAQTLSKSLVRYQRASRAYAELVANMAEQALAELGPALERRLSAEESPRPGLQELYDIWLTVNEGAYERMLSSERYAKLSGELSNSHSALQRDAQVMMDEVLKRFSLPTRKELASTQKRLQQVRRQTRHTMGEELAELRGEMDALREEVRRLREDATAKPRGPGGRD